MTGVTSGDECTGPLRHLDSFLDRSLSARDTALVDRHLQSCPNCAGEFEVRELLRARLKRAVHNESVPPLLESRLTAGLRHQVEALDARRGLHFDWRQMAAIAALLLLCAAGPIVYLAASRGGTANPDALMQVGLGDHIHCAMDSARSEPAVVSGAALGSGYQDLVPEIKSVAPAGYRLTEAHRCTYDGREFVHLILGADLGGGSQVMSLVVTRKRKGETFAGASRADAPGTSGRVYLDRSDRYQIAALETPEHLVYLVSNWSERANTATMNVLSPAVRRILS